MMFLKRHKTAVALVAMFALVGGAAHLGSMNCSGPCAITSLFSTTTAYAGPGCSASKASANGSCDASSKASNVTAASATSADGKECTKESCVKAIMAEKNISQAEAEVVYAKMKADGHCEGSAKVMTASAGSGECASKASVQTASASGGCSASKANASLASSGECASKASATTASASGCSSSKANASLASSGECASKASAMTASATEGKTCGDKEACIAKCMAEKGMSRAQAEECYAKCQSAKATQANVITGSEFTRDSWIDAKVASGLTRAEAEVAAAKAEASGDVKFVTASATGCSASKASASGAGCCASKASANTAKVEETAPATTTTVSTGGTK